MSHYTANVRWERGAQPFLDNRYSRAHRWEFDGGIEVPASSSPSVVPLPMSRVEAVDPEEAFVASLSSCHMLWFLSIAARQRFLVDTYHDRAEGVMAENADGKLAIVCVTLRPFATFAGNQGPTPDQLAALHYQAHEECYLARSVLTEVICQPRLAPFPWGG
jgi:organic hydroperoxide reductase OsmC/OhrA